MTKPIVIIVGADKGGVGKTTVSRALLDYLKAQAINHRAFDTENEMDGGVLKRFFPDRTEIVDLSDSDDQMKVFDTLDAAVTVIDIKAGLLSPTLKLLQDIGFLDPARYEIIVLHILSNNEASAGEVGPVKAALGASARHILVGNRSTATKFAFPPGSIEIPMLIPDIAEVVDKANQPFSVFATTSSSAVRRGMVKKWLDAVFAAFAGAKLP
ncbi:MAG: hypothetical protein WA418_39220 [Bradyrhizobium sp.]